LKTIDGDYGGGCYDWKGVKIEGSSSREKMQTGPWPRGGGAAAVGDTTWADMRQPTRVRMAGGVLATSGGRRVRLAGAAHWEDCTSAHGARGATLSHGRRWRPARRAGVLLGAHDEMAMTHGLVRAT
jgi:hypothetical protein